MENTLLNLIPAAYLPEIHLSQYDVGRTITFTLKDGASDYSVPSGASVKVKATKPSGFGFEVACTFNGGTVTLVTTDTMTPENGRFPAELSIVSGNTTIGTSNFIFNIERSPHPEGTIDGDAESLLPELTLLVERIEAAADSVDEDTQTVTEAKAEVLQAKADTLQAKADTLSARDDALQAKADAITAKESAEASAQAAAESAQEAEDTLSEYAKVDGYYEEFTAGSAEQLLSTQFVEDSVPYKYRTSGGSKDIGNREYDEIVGGSIVWNQLQPLNGLPATQTITGVTLTNNGDGSVTLSGTNTGSSSAIFSCTAFPYTIPVGHKVLLTGASGMNWGGPFTVYDSGIGSLSAVKTSGGIVYNKTGTYTKLDIAVWAGSTVNVRFSPIVCDLTQMFGSQVADYIYSLETAESGKGVALFKSLFPNDYYPYNAGELLSVEGLQSHDTVGFNQFDIDDANLVQGNFDAQGPLYNVVTMNYTKVLPNTVYNLHDTIGSQGRYLRFYNDAKELVGTATQYNATDATFTTPLNACYVKTMWYHGSGLTVAQVQNGNVCLNLSWSGWRNGEYEPYKKHSYALDSSLTLRGIPKLSSQNELYFDGDIYSHDGKVQRKYGEYDLGDWDGAYVGDGYFSGKVLPYIKKCDNSLNANCVCKAYIVDSANNINNNVSDKRIGVNSEGRIVIRDTSFADIASFKTAMSGVMLVYELATPTEETAEPYASPQNVDDFGTEEYISGNVVPVGHNTQYPANLRDKLQHLPNIADSDGYYMISQQNKQMSLEVFRIPKAPTTDGTYILKATVSGGTPTYVWEAVE